MCVVGVFVLFFSQSITSTSAPPRFNPKTVVPSPLPPIIEPPIVSAMEAGQSLNEAELVLGVTIGDESRAYPINMLTGPQREIINDELAGQAIAATWSHLCHNGIVYARQVKDRKLTFAVSGMLWQSNLVMMDQESGGLWSQILGTCMQGPLEGAQLATLPSTMTDWNTWRRHHPRTTVLVMPRTSERFRREIYREASKYVLGVASGRKARAWPFDQLYFVPVLNDSFLGVPIVVAFHSESGSAYIYDRRVDGQTLSFTFRNGALVDEQTGTKWSWATGKARTGELHDRQLKPLVGLVSYRRAWEEFHPKSQFWGAQ